jgi:hypothetical protein
VHVGCVTVTSAIAGAPGAGLITTFGRDEVQLAAFFTITVYVPGAKPANVVPDWNVTPSILYVNPALTGASTVIIPVGTVHVGCVTVTSATAGAPGAGLIIILGVSDVHPAAFFTVTI